MMAKNEDHPDDDWTPEERELLASLPRERIAPAGLKRRTLDAVCGQRRVGMTVSASSFASRRPYALAIAAAAAAVIFVAGALVGFAVARRSAPVSGAAHSMSHEAVASTAPKHDTTTVNQLRLVVWY